MVALVITVVVVALLPPSGGSLSGAYDGLKGDRVGNYGNSQKDSPARLFDDKGGQEVARTKRFRTSWSVPRDGVPGAGVGPTDPDAKAPQQPSTEAAKPLATPKPEKPDGNGDRDQPNPDGSTAGAGAKPLLPRPSPVTPLPGSPSTDTPLLADKAFVEAVHRTGAATAGELGAALAPGGRPPIVVGMGDAGFLPMILNFIATSVQRHSIQHYLVVALDKGMCKDVPTLDGAVICVDAPGNYGAGGEFGSVEFARIVNVKSEVVMAIARLGYDVLLVDGDIVFLQNPLPVLAQNNKDTVYDLQIQDDAEAERNSGFMLVKATPAGLAFIAKAVDIARQDKTLRQQPAINQAIRSMDKRFKHLVLPTAGFPCGKAYFEKPRRMFAHEHPCRECVIMHNNWIVGTVAKVLRFKESLQWLVDGPDAYYSSPDRKYIEFGNPAKDVALPMELGALRAAMAIGRMLKRTVIMPVMRCHGCSVYGLGGTKQGCSGSGSDPDSCGFTAHYGIREFTANMGQESFRERMFRYNPLTPADPPAEGQHAVRLAFDATVDGEGALAPSPESQWVIATSTDLPALGDDASVTQDLRPADLAKGPSQDEILKWFGADSSPVLRFKHLYGVRTAFGKAEDQAEFDKAWAAAIVKNTLRQY